MADDHPINASLSQREREGVGAALQCQLGWDSCRPWVNDPAGREETGRTTQERHAPQFDR